MATLNSLIIHQFRHVAPGTKLTFRPTINVILGQNGTGKTTLLNLISHVVRMDVSQILDVPFDLEWDATTTGGATGSAKVHARVKNLKQERPPTEPPASAGQAETPPRQGPSFSLSYEVTLSGADDRPIVKAIWGDSPSVAIHGKVVPGARPPPPPSLAYALAPQYFLPRQKGSGPATEASGLFAFSDVMAQHSTFRFDEGLEMYKFLTGPVPDAPSSTSGRPYLRIGRTATRIVQFSADYVPQSLTSKLFGTYFGPRAAEPFPVQDLRFKRETLPMLDKVCTLMKFADCEMSFGLVKRETLEGVEYSTFGAPKFHITKNDGSVIQDQLLSYGQKRLLAFAYYLESCPSTAIVDELVNGFHYEWIKGSLELCKGRQLFLTSQNPLLLDSLEIDSLEDVEKTFILCRTRRPDEELEQATWRNISKPDANVFFDALSQGFQGVSEVLRNLGLW